MGEMNKLCSAIHLMGATARPRRLNVRLSVQIKYGAKIESYRSFDIRRSA